jgi:2-methylcitrate dehydratase PrpD
MSISQDLADRIVRLSQDDLTSRAVDNAKTVILDTVGCALAGADEPVVRTLLRTPGLATPGPVSLIGRGERLDPLCAALVNGAAAHALDFDDVNVAIGGHPSAPVLPALLALAETQKVSGRDVLLAFVAGFETETRLARCVNFHHYEKGWHPTATMGVFGAAAACAKLLGLRADQVAMALSMCGSLASGIKANFGTMTKPFHVGHCARNGLMAALLAREGFTANPDAFEHKQGFFLVYNGAGTFDAAAATRDWAAPLDIVAPGIGIKLYPCCDSTHTALDALFTLVKRHGFAADDVARMDVLVHPLRLLHVDRPTLATELDAKFSVQYCLARGLLDGRIGLDSFGTGPRSEPRLQELMARVTATPHPDPSQAIDGNYLTELTVTLTDGRRLHLKMDSPYGRRAEDPAPPELIAAKFDGCAAKALPPRAVLRLRETLLAFETLDDVAALGRAWTPRQGVPMHA